MQAPTTKPAANCEAHVKEEKRCGVGDCNADAVKQTLTAAEVSLRGRRSHVHPDDGLHGYLRAWDRYRRRREEDRLKHAEVALLRDESAAPGVTLH